MGGPDPTGERAIFFWGGDVAAHCNAMGHSTVSCAKTAEQIDMPFWTKTRVCIWNYVLYGGADP